MKKKEKAVLSGLALFLSAFFLTFAMPLATLDFSYFLGSFTVILFGPIYHIIDGPLFDNPLGFYMVAIVCPTISWAIFKDNQCNYFLLCLNTIIWTASGALGLFFVIVYSV